MKDKFTPNYIESLEDNEVFVFGSNLDGYHLGGAARIAKEYFGAVWGQGVGLQGKSYAIPTMQGGVETITPYVDEFLSFAQQHKELQFLVTRIGCGIAGFKDYEIAPLFKNAIVMENICLPKEFVEIINGTQQDMYNLQRFLGAQSNCYQQALQEIQGGQIRSHWIWFIFPQLAILGHSRNAKYYGISGYDEAEAYLNHPILGERLRVITKALLTHTDMDVVDIFGEIDAMKVCSCMTLFDAVSPDDVFQKVLDGFYKGQYDLKTLNYM